MKKYTVCSHEVLVLASVLTLNRHFLTQY